MALKGFRDWIGLVEAAYSLEGADQEWLTHFSNRAEPAFNMGYGIALTLARIASPQDYGLEYAVVRGSRQLEEALAPFTSSLTWPMLQLMLSHGSAARTLSEVIYPVDPGHAELIRQSSSGQDMLVVICNSAAQRVLFLSSPLAEQRGVTRVERRRLNQLAAHLGAGLRLRTHLANLDLLDHHRTEAIFHPDGRVLDARGAATPKTVRDRLRSAVMQTERARGPLRRQDPGEALSLWEALIDGRWSLVDHFDGDGSRKIVAVQNESGVRDPRGLTPLELRIAETLGEGKSAKEIGYILGISVSAVNNAIAEIKIKLAMRARAEVASFFAPGGVRAQLNHVDIGDLSLVVGGYGSTGDDALTALTEAERAVALLLLQGATNRAIAETRGCSYNTISNQIKAIYNKLQVGNRGELAALLATGSTTGGDR